jgi:hypothetical protein
MRVRSATPTYSTLDSVCLASYKAGKMALIEVFISALDGRFVVGGGQSQSRGVHPRKCRSLCPG